MAEFITVGNSINEPGTYVVDENRTTYKVDENGELHSLKTHTDVSFEARQRDIAEQERLEEETRELRKKNKSKNWDQHELKYDAYIDYLMKKYPNAARLYTCIRQFMDRSNALVCSQKFFEEYLGVSQSTVKRSIKLLKDLNYVRIAKTGSSNIYYLNPDIDWKGYDHNRAYAEFYKYAEMDNVNVLFTLSEQENTLCEKHYKRATKNKHTNEVYMKPLEPSEVDPLACPDNPKKDKT